MAIDKIDELEQLPLSMLPDDWPLPVKLAWQDNTNTTNITSETVNLSLTEAEKVQQTQASQGTQLAQLSQSVTQQGQDVATAKQEAQTALTAANSIASKADKAEQDAASALIEATAAKQSAKTNETGIGSNLTAIQQLQIAIKNLPSDTKLENEIQANASSITKLQDAINNLPSDTKLENEIQANASSITKLQDAVTKLQNASVSVDLATLDKAGIVKQARWVDNPPRRAPRISSMDVPLLSSYLNMLVDFVVDLDKNLRDAGIVGQKPPKGGKG